MINYIIWNTSPTLFSVGPFVLRWYALLFILGFILCRLVLLRIYKTEGKPTTDVETISKYIFIAVIIGARLGYVVFYEPELIVSKPLEIFLPIEFKPTFHFAGIDKLSSHGAVLGILFVLWIYSRKGKPGQSYLQVLDRVSILTALVVIFVGLGNFFNAEITGKPTASKLGVVFATPVNQGIEKIPCCIMRNPGGENPIEYVTAKKTDGQAPDTTGRSAMILYLFFKAGATEQLVNEFLMGDVKTYLFDRSDLVYEPGTEPLHYTIFAEKDTYTARVRTSGIARHPVQLYESFTCIILFIFLFRLWNKHKLNTPSGRISGYFLTVFGIMLFGFAYLKENQDPVTDQIALSVGQLMSILLIVIGAVVLVHSYKKVAVKS